MPPDGKENAPAGVNGEGTQETGAVRVRQEDYASRFKQTEPLFEASLDVITLYPWDHEEYDPDTGALVKLGKQPGKFVRYAGGRSYYSSAGWRRWDALDRVQAAAAMESGQNLGFRLDELWLVFDYDPRNDPTGEGAAKLEAALGMPLSSFPTVVTGSGGRHHYARIGEGVSCTQLIEVDYARFPGYELKKHGRQVVAPGSLHPVTGRPYVWEDGTPDLADAPRLDRRALDPFVKRSSGKGDSFDGCYAVEQATPMLFGPLDPDDEDAWPTNWRQVIALNPENFSDEKKWRDLGMAWIEATGGCDLAKDLFARWSALDTLSYEKGGNALQRIMSFGASGGITRKTLFRALYDAKAGRYIPRGEAAEPIPAAVVEGEVMPSEGGAVARRPRLEYNKAGSSVLSSTSNAVAAIGALGLDLGYNVLSKTYEVRSELPWADLVGAEYSKAMVMEVKILIERTFADDLYVPSMQDVDAAIKSVAYKSPFNPVLEWIEATEWDGIPRLYRLFPEYFRTAPEGVAVDDYVATEAGRLDSEYGVRLCIGLMQRLRRPGSKFDTLPILEGRQGFDKTSGIKLLFSFGDEERWTGRVSFKNLDQKDKLIGMQGKVFLEVAELDGMGDSSVESIKAFLDMQSDSFRPPYEVVAQEHPRTFVFGGTTNRGAYLSDETGARRFWPMKVHAPVDKAAIARDLRQLWAEAAHLEAGGMDSILPRELWQASDRRTAAQTVKDDITVRLDEILGAQEELLRLQIQVERTDILMEFGDDGAKLAEVARLYREKAGEDVGTDDADIFGALSDGPIVRIGSELRIGSSRLADRLSLTARHKGTFGKIRNHMTRRGWEYRDMVRSPQPGAGYVKRV